MTTCTKFSQQLTPFKQNDLLSVVALAVLNNNTCALLPRIYRTKFLSWTASKIGLPHSKLGFQRNNVSHYSSLAVTLSLVRCFKNARARSTSPTPVATRNVLACGTFHLAPKPVVKTAVRLTAAACFVECRLKIELANAHRLNNFDQTHRRRPHRSTESKKAEHT